MISCDDTLSSDSDSLLLSIYSTTTRRSEGRRNGHNYIICNDWFSLGTLFTWRFNPVKQRYNATHFLQATMVDGAEKPAKEVEIGSGP